MAGTETQKAYAAGLIDGEGCIDIGYNGPNNRDGNFQLYPRVTVHITNVRVVEWLQDLWGGSIHVRSACEDQKTSYTWKIHSTRATDFIRELQPYLIVKADEAEVFLRFSKKSTGVARLHRLSAEEVGARLCIKKTLSFMKGN